MVDLGSVSLEWGTLLFQLLVLFFYSLLIYFLFSVIKFMRHKTRHDEERNQMLGELLKILRSKE